jgi:hypothetical protein
MSEEINTQNQRFATQIQVPCWTWTEVFGHAKCTNAKIKIGKYEHATVKHIS